MIRLGLILLVFPAFLQAQTLSERIETGTTISMLEWQEMTRGRTVVYQNFGVEVGREYYPPDGNQVFYRFNDGTCLEGRVISEPPKICFNWASLEKMCFLHKDINGDIVIIGDNSGGIIFISDIVDNDPFRCQPEMMSSLPRTPFSASPT